MRISHNPANIQGLTNDGEWLLFFISSGSAFAKTLDQTNVWVIKGDDRLRIDCGTKCSLALHEDQIPIANIEHYIITQQRESHRPPSRSSVVLPVCKATKAQHDYRP